MSTTSTLLRRVRPALAVAAVIGTTALAQPAVANAAPDAASPATTARPTMTSSSLLSIEDIAAAGLPVDGATLDTRGDAWLNDAGRFDEGCLHDKTIRAIAGSKPYPEPAPGYRFFDGTWDNTQDKDVYATESIAQVPTAASAKADASKLLDEIAAVRSCETDPAQGHHYGKAHQVTVGKASATYFYDYNFEGPFTGGGVAVVRDGNRFGIVSLMFAPHGSASTLKKLATTAATNLR